MNLALTLSPSPSLCLCVIYTVFLDFSFAGLHKPHSILWFSPLFSCLNPAQHLAHAFGIPQKELYLLLNAGI
jgi:hypothetical protein